jgi:hypothetical protein
MSLDFYLREPHTCPKCGHQEPSDAEPVYHNYTTHNLGKMANKAGIYEALWRSTDSKAGDLIPSLEKGLAKLRAKPVYYAKYTPPNGYGTYAGLVTFTEDVLRACRLHPNAVVECSV